MAFSLPVFGEGRGGVLSTAPRLLKQNPTLPSPKTGRDSDGTFCNIRRGDECSDPAQFLRPDSSPAPSPSRTDAGHTTRSHRGRQARRRESGRHRDGGRAGNVDRRQLAGPDQPRRLGDGEEGEIANAPSPHLAGSNETAGSVTAENSAGRGPSDPTPRARAAAINSGSSA